MTITLPTGAMFRTTKSGVVRYFRTPAQVWGTECTMTAAELTVETAEALDRMINASAYR